MINAPDHSVAPAALLPDALADLSLRQLLSFRAVAEEGSFHGAADALDYTQSAISQHVAALERGLGVRLLERSRGKRTVRLTEAGILVLDHVNAIASRLQSARADLLAYTAGEIGTLRVGVYASVGARILPAILTRFTQAWPGVEVQLTEIASEGEVAAIEVGTLDLTFGVLPLPPGPFEAAELVRDPIVLVVARDSPLAAGGEVVPLAALATQRIITFRSPGAVTVLLDDLQHQGIDLTFALRTDDNSIVQAMARAGLGAALAPRLAVQEDDPAVRVLRLDLPPRRIALVWHRDRYRSTASRAFVDIARSVCREHAGEFGLPEPEEPAGILRQAPTTS